ncbi:MAG: DUF1232 domain-containing protein [Polyangiaceae bacterium]|jgi:uncharacterized membrane protein YkvA (DUF1232 family)
MALVELPDVAAGIAAVREEDVEKVRQSVPAKLAAMRSLLGGGHLGTARNLLRDVHMLFQILLDRSFPVPWRTTAAIVFGLGYFLMAADLIPDVIPVVGFLDDALVMAEIVYLLSGDLKRFRVHQAATARAKRARRERASVPEPPAQPHPAPEPQPEPQRRAA